MAHAEEDKDYNERNGFQDPESPEYNYVDDEDEEDAEQVQTPQTPLIHPTEVHDINEEGSDMTRDIYVALFREQNRQTAKSMPDISEIMHEDVGKASDLAQPGGFRRGHIIGNADAEVPTYAQEPFLQQIHPKNIVRATYDSFIYANLDYAMSREDFEKLGATTPLLSRPRPYKRQTRQKEAQDRETDGASAKKTIFTILKSFIGSGILFLPRAFANGGLLFSVCGLFVSALFSIFCMLRLTDCYNVISASTCGGVSYGYLGERSFGRAGRIAVNVSLVLSQLGFCCSYLIFVEQNVGDILEQVFHVESSYASLSWLLIILQIPLYTPLTWVRRIEYFAITNIVADIFILLGLLYIVVYSLEQVVERQPTDETTWTNFNSKSWALFLGTAVYAFEGIGLVLPIYDSMASSVQHKFPKILAVTLFLLVAVECFFAGAVYVAFGTSTESVVTLNLPSAGDNWPTMFVQLSYSLALIFTYPLMLYPVVMILEGYTFTRARKGYWRWQKNGFRFMIVCVTAVIAYCGKSQLDNFVSLVGGFCSVPLAFIYPCLFHSKLVDDGHVANGIVVGLGVLTMVFASSQAIATWD